MLLDLQGKLTRWVFDCLNVWFYDTAWCGSRDSAVVRAFASHQCGPGSIPGPGIICGLSLFSVGSLLCSERLSSGYSGFPLSSKTNISKFQFDLECAGISNEFLWTPGAPWVNKLHYITFTARYSRVTDFIHTYSENVRRVFLGISREYKSKSSLKAGNVKGKLTRWVFDCSNVVVVLRDWFLNLRPSGRRFYAIDRVR